MSTHFSDFAIGAIVITLTVATVTYFLVRSDDCLDKARDFVSSAPAVTTSTGKVISAGTSSWLSAQAVSKAGERSFFFLVKGERATANVIVSADRATCTCRLESISKIL